MNDNPYKTIPEEIEGWLINYEYGFSKEIPKLLAENRILSKQEKNEALLNAQIAEKEKEAALNKAQIAEKEKEKIELDKKILIEQDKNKRKLLEEERKRRIVEIKSLKEQEEKNKQTAINKQKDSQLKSEKKVRVLVIIVAIGIIFTILVFLWFLNRSRNKIQSQAKTLQERAEELEASQEELKQTNDSLLVSEEELKQTNEELAAQRDKLAESSARLEELLEETRAQKELVEIQKKDLEALQSTKDLMISAVNHDLRNPLNPIINFSGNYPKKTEKERLTEIHTHAHLMLKLIDNIMQVYRADNLTIQATPNSLHRAANEAIQVMSLAQSRKPRIINDIPTELQALFDYNYIERVFENLLSNAIKYTPSEEKGGIVRFTATLTEGTTPLSFGEGETPPSGVGGLVRLSITDNGKGIPKDQFEKIFLPFVNPDAKSIGSAKSVGIGLTFCKTIIEAHKSKIDIQSEVGKGTTFSFVLPYVVPETQEDKSQASNLAVVQLNEDERQAVQSLISEIQKIGFHNAKLKRFLQGMEVGASEKLQAWKNALLKAREARDRELFEKMLGN